MFHFSLTNIIDLIVSQISEIRRVGYPTKVSIAVPGESGGISYYSQYVFLSGGFAESPYVYREVTEFCQQRDIRVDRPERPYV
jgi:hypothetical protein